MKIIELILDELEDFAGFDAVALVNQPAIEAGFHAFNSNIVHDSLALQIIKLAMVDEFDLDVTGLPDFQTTGSYDSHDLHFDVSVVETEDGNKYVINGEITPDIQVMTGCTYCFDQSDESNEGHPLRISTTKNGVHDGGEEYTNGVAVMDNKLYLQITEDTPKELYYYCINHSGMGNDSKIKQIREMSSLPDDKFFDDLSTDKQEKLLERLEQVGYSKDELLNDYTITNEPQKFALPSRSSANPDGPTQTKGAYKILYKYNGPRDSKTRTFCKRLLDLDLLFRKEDIQKMSLQGANSSEFGYYDIFQYKGSYGCRHNWVKQYVYQKKSVGLLEVAALLLDQERQTKENIKNPQVVSEFSKQYKFATDDDQQIVVGPMMIPNKLILRVDDEGNPYQVYFSEETIRDIAYRMMEQKKLDEINLEHEQDNTVDGYMLESWIVESVENDKQQIYGMDHPVGSWMGMYKIEDPKVWELVKNGAVTGFSIEAFLDSRKVQAKKVNI